MTGLDPASRADAVDEGTASAALTVAEVVKTYRRGREHVHALQGVDLTVATGEVVVLLGQSGSGKTTLLNCIAGWEIPDSGSIAVHGDGGRSGAESLTARATPWGDIAIVPQSFGLLEELTLLENVELPARLARSNADHDRALPLLDDLGLASVVNRHPSEVSLGEAQRAAVARALVLRPTLLLADEPTGHLDETVSARALAVLRDRAHADGTAILMASHDLLATSYADRVLRLQDGTLASERRLSG